VNIKNKDSYKKIIFLFEDNIESVNMTINIDYANIKYGSEDSDYFIFIIKKMLHENNSLLEPFEFNHIIYNNKKYNLSIFPEIFLKI